MNCRLQKLSQILSLIALMSLVGCSSGPDNNYSNYRNSSYGQGNFNGNQYQQQPQQQYQQQTPLQQMPPSQNGYYNQAPSYYGGGYQQQVPPSSRYYNNPYALPQQNQYPYYDGDQYYVPPTYYGTSPSDNNVPSPSNQKF